MINPYVVETVNIVPTDPAQGNYVRINAEDFDKKTMKIYDGPENEEAVATSSEPSLAELQAQISALQAQIAAGSSGTGSWPTPPPPAA